jgi:predicted MPP superfamily phosphohydrolase
MNRRKFIGYSALGAAAFAAGDLIVEPRSLETTFHKVALTTRAASRISAVQISDLHLSGVGSHEAKIAEAVRSAKPDLILITGDSLDHRGREQLLAEFMSLLDTQTPKLAILGNWEYWANLDIPTVARIYERHNCELLVNWSATLDFGPNRIRFVGVDDLVGGHPEIHAAFEDTSDITAQVILAHCPKHRDILADESSLMLSGHTHGGQVTLFGWAPFLPAGSGRYNRGWYEPNGNIRGRLYVSRGLGTSMINARSGSLPEVAVFDFMV